MAQAGLIHNLIGASAALGSALVWAYCSILFSRLGSRVSPFSMNIGKCILGIVYLGAVLLFTGMKSVDGRNFIILGVSGLLGIALGDTFFFKALINLGPRLTLLMETLGPAVTVVLAVMLLRERPRLLSWAGIFITIAGIAWVLWENVPQEKEKNKKVISGIKYAFLFIFCNSVAIILAKIGITAVPALDATFIRFLWAFGGLSLWAAMNYQFKNCLMPFKEPSLLKFILFAVFFAIFGGFCLSILALKYIDASIATILGSTTPVFILPLSALILKEKISARKIMGAVVAVTGVIFILWGA